MIMTDAAQWLEENSSETIWCDTWKIKMHPRQCSTESVKTPPYMKNTCKKCHRYQAPSKLLKARADSNYRRSSFGQRTYVSR